MKVISKALRMAYAKGITQFYLPPTRLFHEWNEPSCLYSVRIHQMAPPPTEVADIWLQFTTHLSTPKGWKADLACCWTCSGRFTHIAQITVSVTGVLRLLDHVCGTCCQSIYGCVTVLNSLNGCSRPICLVFETAAHKPTTVKTYSFAFAGIII